MTGKEGGADVQLYSCLTSALDWGWEVNLMCQLLHSWEGARKPTMEENWVCPSAGLDGYGKEIPLPLPAFEHWTVQPTVSHYADCYTGHRK
jgi:hypothetical protein